MGIGRPSIRTPEMVDEIINRVSAGDPLAEICRSEGMPGLRTFYDWVEADLDLSARFARAREAGFDMIAGEALRIADTPLPGDTITIDERGEKVTREDMLGHRKLQVETRLKLLAKWDPKRYGDKQTFDIGGQPGNPLRTESVVSFDALDDEQKSQAADLARRALQGAQ